MNKTLRRTVCRLSKQVAYNLVALFLLLELFRRSPPEQHPSEPTPPALTQPSIVLEPTAATFTRTAGDVERQLLGQLGWE